jgi:hypothetical protein
VFPFPATLNARFLIRLDEVAVTISLLRSTASVLHIRAFGIETFPYLLS